MPTDFIASNPGLIQWILTGLFASFIWVMIRAITKVDKNQSELFKFHLDHETRITKVETVCKTRHQLGDD